MSTLAEIEQAVETLPLGEQEALFRILAARLDVQLPSPSIYRTRTHPGGVRPDVNPDKLGQLPEDFQEVCVMILIDVNLLIYAVFADSPRHQQARGWLDAVLGDSVETAARMVMTEHIRP